MAPALWQDGLDFSGECGGPAKSSPEGVPEATRDNWILVNASKGGTRESRPAPVAQFKQPWPQVAISDQALNVSCSHIVSNGIDFQGAEPARRQDEGDSRARAVHGEIHVLHRLVLIPYSVANGDHEMVVSRFK